MSRTTTRNRLVYVHLTLADHSVCSAIDQLRLVRLATDPDDTTTAALTADLLDILCDAHTELRDARGRIAPEVDRA